MTEAKSLLEQVALVSQGRTMYATCLASIASYVKDDLLGGTLTNGRGDATAPSVVLSARPDDDPLEAILYLTSVGVPGQIYDTVRSLRQARARRLGARQRKVPAVHLLMLWILGGLLLLGFPVLVGVAGAASGDVRTLQGGLFATIAFAMVLAKNVLGELWTDKRGAYSVDGVLMVMVQGLQKELRERMKEAIATRKRATKES